MNMLIQLIYHFIRNNIKKNQKQNKIQYYLKKLIIYYQIFVEYKNWSKKN